MEVPGMNNAELIQFYMEFVDFDYLDYTENITDDINYIKELINKYGIQKARKILMEYFEM